MGQLIGIFGASGFGREVLSLLRKQVMIEGRVDAKLVFVERSAAPPVNGVAVMAEADFLSQSADRGFVVAIADGKLRQALHRAAVASGAAPIAVTSPSAEILDCVEIGAGAVLCGHCTVSANATVGEGFHLNIGSYLAHDCRVGNFVTFGPNVVCAGNVVIEDLAYVGGGALIRQGSPSHPITIGAGAVIGMGAVVTKSVAAGTVVVGNPARVL